MIKNDVISTQRDNQSKTYISENPVFTGFTEVVGTAQMCIILLRMQHVCSRYATKLFMICMGHFSVEILGNVLFCAFLQAVQSANGSACNMKSSNFINRIY